MSSNDFLKSVYSDTPLVSVIILYYKNDDTIELCLKSLIMQTYTKWEAVIVDDGSNDNLSIEVNKFKHKFKENRIEVITHQKNYGRAKARQTALDNVQGSFVTMLDADDWIIPEKLELQLSYFKQYSEVALVSTAIYLVDNNDNLLWIDKYKYNSEDFSILGPLKKIPRTLPIPHAPSMIKTDIAKKFKYDARLFVSEDFDFLIGILLTSKFIFINKPTYVYRYQNNKTYKKVMKQINTRFYIYFKWIKKYPLNIFVNIANNFFLKLFYMTVYFFGLKKIFFSLRFKTPQENETKIFENYRNSIK